jgi:hypothetical protein
LGNTNSLTVLCQCGSHCTDISETSHR